MSMVIAPKVSRLHASELMLASCFCCIASTMLADTGVTIARVASAAVALGVGVGVISLETVYGDVVDPSRADPGTSACGTDGLVDISTATSLVLGMSLLTPCGLCNCPVFEVADVEACVSPLSNFPDARIGLCIVVLDIATVVDGAVNTAT